LWKQLLKYDEPILALLAQSLAHITDDTSNGTAPRIKVKKRLFISRKRFWKRLKNILAIEQKRLNTLQRS